MYSCLKWSHFNPPTPSNLLYCTYKELQFNKHFKTLPDNSYITVQIKEFPLFKSMKKILS